MRILFLTRAFNGLAQRLYCELTERGHLVSIELDIADSVAEEAVALFAPDLIVAPYLRRAIPESIWQRYVCLVVHPGIVGDRGPSALDWAVLERAPEWGVTVLQAEAEMDAGPVWASETFPMRAASKSSLYRDEVTEAAARAVVRAVELHARGGSSPARPSYDDPAVRGRPRPPMRQAERAIDWSRDTTADVLAKIDAADGSPGVADVLFGEPCRLFDARAEAQLRGAPGELLARRETALCRATVDGAVWIGHAKREGGFKLPATVAFPEQSEALPEARLEGFWAAGHATWQDIRYEEAQHVGVLRFDFTNGAMGTRQCRRLLDAYRWATARPTRVIVLAGGRDFWSNGIHLALVEAAESPADESLANIEAIDDLAEAIIRTESHLTIAAVRGGCGAGGCFLARAADIVWVRNGALMNPHYEGMGNLYGSEYWTYLLPARVGEDGARAIMRGRMPLTAKAAVDCGLVDARLPADAAELEADVARRAAELARAPDLATRLAAKRERRARDEAAKPLAAYRAEELEHMRRNFYGFDPSYHVARHHFVVKSPPSWTPRHLAKHRALEWKAPR